MASNGAESSSSASSDGLGRDGSSDTSIEYEEKSSAETFDSYPASLLELPDHHIDDVRSLRVSVIGAGIAGINAGILLPAKVPKIQLTVFEKNEEVVSLAYESLFHRS